MFDHLDDPEPFTPGEPFRAEVRHRGRRRRRAVRLARTGVALVALLVAGAAVAAAYVTHRLDGVDRVHVAGLAPTPGGGAPYTVLVVGLDRVGALAPDDPVAAGRGDVAGERADTVVVLRVDPAQGRIGVLGLPRDLIPPETRGMSDTRLGRLRGTDLIETLDASFGIEVNRYVEVDLGGAVAVGDAVGGLRLAFDRPVRDPRSGLDLPIPGCHTLDGHQVLAVARARHLEAQAPDGSWVRDPTSDLGRIQRQGPLVEALLRSLTRIDTTSPSALDRVFDTVIANVTLDADASRGELVRLFRDIAGSTVVRYRLPVVDGQHPTPDGPLAVLHLGEGADEAIARFRTGEAPATDPRPGPPTGGAAAPVILATAC